jgi:hypothetical protein
MRSNAGMANREGRRISLRASLRPQHFGLAVLVGAAASELHISNRSPDALKCF